MYHRGFVVDTTDRDTAESSSSKEELDTWCLESGLVVRGEEKNRICEKEVEITEIEE